MKIYLAGGFLRKNHAKKIVKIFPQRLFSYYYILEGGLKDSWKHHLKLKESSIMEALLEKETKS